MRVLIPVTSLILSTAATGAFGAACNGTSVYPPCFNPTLSDINYNTAGGSAALASLTNSAVLNTAFGHTAMANLSTGAGNTALGAYALYQGDGSFNTAIGASALANSTTGSQTAVGYWALKSNTSGEGNTAVGAYGMERTTSGSNNVALGRGALRANETGNANIALGNQALLFSTGAGNIAVGSGAGKTLTTGSNNIYVGNAGLSSESGTIRIGAGVHTRIFLAGIVSSAVGNPATVEINTATGQLGIAVSSLRYKDDVRDLKRQADKLADLRPVSFTYKADASHGTRYGLIAEEVAQVYPEIVSRNANGEVETVEYQALIPLLLKQNQQQQARIEALEKEVAQLARQRKPGARP